MAASGTPWLELGGELGGTAPANLADWSSMPELYHQCPQMCMHRGRTSAIIVPVQTLAHSLHPSCSTSSVGSSRGTGRLGKWLYTSEMVHIHDVQTYTGTKIFT